MWHYKYTLGEIHGCLSVNGGNCAYRISNPWFTNIFAARTLNQRVVQFVRRSGPATQNRTPFGQGSFSRACFVSKMYWTHRRGPCSRIHSSDGWKTLFGWTKPCLEMVCPGIKDWISRISCKHRVCLSLLTERRKVSLRTHVLPWIERVLVPVQGCALGMDISQAGCGCKIH